MFVKYIKAYFTIALIFVIIELPQQFLPFHTIRLLNLKNFVLFESIVLPEFVTTDSPTAYITITDASDHKIPIVNFIYLTESSSPPSSYTCTYISPLYPITHWETQFPPESADPLKFIIFNNTLGPSTPTLMSPVTFSSTSTSSLPISSLISNTTVFGPIINLPLNEYNPGLYFWWLYPEQIHLSWTENANEITVTWVTYLDLKSRLVFRSSICSGDSSSMNWTVVDATTYEFNEGEKITRVQYIHTAVVQDVQSECFYEYMVGAACFWSDLYSFRGKTPYKVATGNVQRKSKVIVVGDWGYGILAMYTKNILEARLRITTVDAILHLGDFAYDLQDLEGRQGDNFLNMIQPIASKIPYMTIPGNHETSHNMSQYSNRFNMPVNDANEGLGWFYSFNLGYAHYIMFNAEQYYLDLLNETIETHVNWLIEDLKEAERNRNEVPWVFFMLHRAFYCSTYTGKQCLDDADLLRNELEQYLYDYKVDLVIQAHVHNYERYKAVFNGRDSSGDDDFNYYRNPKAPVYIINGNAGNFEAHNDPFTDTPPDTFLFGSQDYGFGMLDVLNKSMIYYEQYSSERNQVIDYFYIIKT